MIGQRVSHYEILDKLGSGGMGVVYRARDLKLDRTVALKFLSSELSMSAEERNRFVREAKAASALDHPNIGVVFDIDETPDGQTFIAMAYYAGETLKQRMAARPALDQNIGVAIQVAQGLAKAHSQGIIHRDIKPSNIIVTSDGVAKIIDFGLAMASDATLSLAAAARGTPAYMSPEQAVGEEVDARTDVWALVLPLGPVLIAAPVDEFLVLPVGDLVFVDEVGLHRNELKTVAGRSRTVPTGPPPYRTGAHPAC